MIQNPNFKITADLLYLDAYFFLERLGIKDKIDAKIIALTNLQFYIDHDTENKEYHEKVRRRIAAF